MRIASLVKSLIGSCVPSAIPSLDDGDLDIPSQLAPVATLSEPLNMPSTSTLIETTQPIVASVDRVNQVGGESTIYTIRPGFWRFTGVIASLRQANATGAEITDNFALDIMDPANNRSTLVAIIQSHTNCDHAAPFNFDVFLRGRKDQVWSLILRCPGCTGAGLYARCKLSGLVQKLL